MYIDLDRLEVLTENSIIKSRVIKRHLDNMEALKAFVEGLIFLNDISSDQEVLLHSSFWLQYGRAAISYNPRSPDFE